MTAVVAPWWVRPGLGIVDGRLVIAGRDAEALVREHGTPLFVYDLERFGENARVLQAAFARIVAAAPAHRPAACQEGAVA